VRPIKVIFLHKFRVIVFSTYFSQFDQTNPEYEYKAYKMLIKYNLIVFNCIQHTLKKLN